MKKLLKLATFASISFAMLTACDDSKDNNHKPNHDDRAMAHACKHVGETPQVLTAVNGVFKLEAAHKAYSIKLSKGQTHGAKVSLNAATSDDIHIIVKGDKAVKITAKQGEKDVKVGAAVQNTKCAAKHYELDIEKVGTIDLTIELAGTEADKDQEIELHVFYEVEKDNDRANMH